MLVGIWNDYLVDDSKTAEHGADPLYGARGPYYAQWLPKSYTDIFFESPNKSNESLYAKDVIKRFMEGRSAVG